MVNKFNILTVSDNPGVTSTVTDLMTETGDFEFELIQSGSTDEALEMIKSRMISVIIIDFRVPNPEQRQTEIYNFVSQVNFNIPILIMFHTVSHSIALTMAEPGARNYFFTEGKSAAGRFLSKLILHATEIRQAEVKIREYQRLFDCVEQAVYGTDMDGTVTNWNRASEKIYGWSADEIIGKNISLLFSGLMAPEISYIYGIIKAGLDVEQYMCTQYFRTDRRIDVVLNALMVGNIFGEAVGVSFVCENITEKKFSEQKLAIQYRTAVIMNESDDMESTATGILSTVCEILEWQGGEFWMLDPAASALRYLAGWSYTGVVNGIKTEKDMIPADFKQGILNHIWNKKTLWWTDDIRREHAPLPGKILSWAVVKCLLAIPVMSGQTVKGVILFFSDYIPQPDYSMMTMFMSMGEQFSIFIRRMEVESEKNRFQADLLAKNIELQEQTDFLREANQAKTTFLANMSHELRTPLNSIIGFTELIFKGRAGPVSDEHKTYLSEVAINGHHLLNLINDVLDLTRVEAGKITPKYVDTRLSQIVSEVHHSMELFLTEKKLCFTSKIDSSLPAEIRTDPEKLKQILFNYLSNAIKFTPAHGKINVSVSREKDGFFRIEVSDSGIGMTQSDITKLFVMFEQLNISYSKPYQGIGLGLALTRHIAEAMGGWVGVVSEPGKGSNFYAVLPLIVHRETALRST